MNQLQTLLHELRLSGLRETLTVRLHEAQSNRLTHEEFLTLALQDEVHIRAQRKIQRRVKVADFRTLKPLDEFDWRFNSSIPRKQLYDLAACHFIRAKTDVLLIGPPGTGKTHLAQALGYEAIKQGFSVCYRSIFDLVRDFLSEDALPERDRLLKAYLKSDLLIIDDMGLRSLPKHSGEYLLEVIMRRYETRSTIMTSNRPLEDWGKLLQDVPTAGAVLDRFLHHAAVIAITGESYRLKDSVLTRAKKQP
jgi:DNA replication protein DnaC